jgi:hypothetical protein
MDGFIDVAQAKAVGCTVSEPQLVVRTPPSAAFSSFSFGAPPRAAVLLVSSAALDSGVLRWRFCVGGCDRWVVGVVPEAIASRASEAAARSYLNGPAALNGFQSASLSSSSALPIEAMSGQVCTVSLDLVRRELRLQIGVGASAQLRTQPLRAELPQGGLRLGLCVADGAAVTFEAMWLKARLVKVWCGA